MRIPVTRNFDTSDLIGQLVLRDDVEIPPDSVFSLGYTVQEFKDGKPVKIQLQSISLIPDGNYLAYLEKEKEQLL